MAHLNWDFGNKPFKRASMDYFLERREGLIKTPEEPKLLFDSIEELVDSWTGWFPYLNVARDDPFECALSKVLKDHTCGYSKNEIIYRPGGRVNKFLWGKAHWESGVCEGDIFFLFYCQSGPGIYNLFEEKRKKENYHP